MVRKVMIERYFPDVIAYAKEFRDIAAAENPEFDLLYAEMLKWFKNGFVVDFDNDGARRWERMLSIVPDPDDTLEERRRRILAIIAAMLPYTHRRLEELLNDRFGENMVTFKLEYDEYFLTAEIARTLKRSVYKVFCFFRAIIPANLGILIQNTEKIDQSIFSGGIVRQFKFSRIVSDTGFAMNEASGETFVGGIIRQFKKSIVKAGE